MNNMFVKTENLNFAPPIVGAQILQLFKDQKTNKINVLDIMKHLKSQKKISPKTLYSALIFLYTIDLIDFNEPYVFLKNET